MLFYISPISNLCSLSADSYLKMDRTIDQSTSWSFGIKPFQALKLLRTQATLHYHKTQITPKEQN
jgi:hypothetical protein